MRRVISLIDQTAALSRRRRKVGSKLLLPPQTMRNATSALYRIRAAMSRIPRAERRERQPMRQRTWGNSEMQKSAAARRADSSWC